MKKIICIIIAFVLLLSLAIFSYAASDSGDIQDIHWELDKKGTLTFTGNGNVPQSGPWLQYRNETKALVFGNGIKGIDCDFIEFAGLTSITFGPDMNNVQGDLFRSTKLKKIVLQMKTDCFTAVCMNLRVARPTEVEVADDSAYIIEDELVMTKDRKAVVYFTGKGKGKVVIPEGIETIRDSTFQNSNLSEITLPESLKNIDVRAFSGCKKLQKIVFPKSLDKLADHAFSGCTSLKEVVFLNQRMEARNDNAFFEAFGSCEGITQIVLPSMKIISQVMFHNCKNLKTVAIGKGTSKIANGAFENCKSLQTIYIPDSVTDIDPQFFDYSSKLTIYCHEGSYAEKFAKENGYDYVSFIDVTGIVLSESDIVLKKGKTADIKANVEPTDATAQGVNMYSTNETIVTVNKGKIKAVSPGECDIVFAAVDGSGITAICHVIVE